MEACVAQWVFPLFETDRMSIVGLFVPIEGIPSIVIAPSEREGSAAKVKMEGSNYTTQFETKFNERWSAEGLPKVGAKDIVSQWKTSKWWNETEKHLKSQSQGIYALFLQRMKGICRKLAVMTGVCVYYLCFGFNCV